MQIKMIDFGYENMPMRAHANDAGADVYALEDMHIPKGRTWKVGLGFGIDLPVGLMGLIMPRSGLSSNGIVTELPPIDSGYKGEIHAIIYNQSNETFRIKKGDRIAQLVIVPIILPTFVKEAGEERGNNGFGSTGNS